MARLDLGRWKRPLAVVAVIAVLVVSVTGWWLSRKIDPPGAPGETIELIVAEGTSTNGVADLLVARGVVTNATLFKLYAKAKGAGPFQAGTYRMQKNLSMGDAIKRLDLGPALPAASNVTVPEGLVLEQIAQRVDKAVDRFSADAFLALAKSGELKSKYSPPGQPLLEGLLFPDTYRVEEQDTERTLVQQMIDAFDATAQGLGYDQAETKTGYSAYELVIVASLIETEAKSDEERPKIARVIFNRLKQGMPLGIDAAFYYTLPLDRRGTSLRQSDLDRDTPYNTRKRTGLIPTPIAAPGKASLAAALNPVDGPWLYYVLQDERTHAFSTDYQQFLRDMRTAQQKGLIP